MMISYACVETIPPQVKAYENSKTYMNAVEDAAHSAAARAYFAKFIVEQRLIKE